MIGLRTRTTALPILRMAGRELRAASLVQTEDGFEGFYELLIDTWAGRTTLELTDDGVYRTELLEISPHQHKLGADEFDAMLGELSAKSPGLIWGLSPGADRASLSRAGSAVTHPAVIASELPRLERLLARYVADPPVLTLRTRAARPLDLARRADLGTLRRLARKPGVLKALRGEPPRNGAVVDPRTPIDQPQALASLDHPVTRYIAYLLRRLLLRFRKTARVLRIRPGTPFRDPEMEAHAHMLARQMEAAAERVEAALGQPLFRQAQAEPIGETALQSVADHPLYGALHRTARRLLSPGLAYGPQGDLESSLKHTYDLFELLVLHRLIDGLRARLGAGWTLKAGKPLPYAGREERPVTRVGWWFTGPDGASLELRYQQRFGRAKSADDQRMFSSLSGLNMPDYVLAHRRAGSVVGWVILDAKYRSGRQPVDQGLGDVHRYRDALRVRGKPADGAFVIVPRLQESDAVYASEAYRERHAFGVLQLLEEDWLRPVLDRLGLRPGPACGPARA